MQLARQKDKCVIKTEKQTLPHIQPQFLTAANKGVIPCYFNLLSMIIATMLGMQFFFKIFLLSQIGYLKYKIIKTVKVDK